MATRKGINISGTYAVHHKLYAFFIWVLCVIKIERQGRIVFYIVLKNQRRLHPNGCKFELYFF